MHFHPDRYQEGGLRREITPREVFEARREWLKNASLGLGGLALGASSAGPAQAQAPAEVKRPQQRAALAAKRSTLAGAVVSDKLTPFVEASTYNNYYEFGTDKYEPGRTALGLKTRPWTLRVEGEVAKPRSFDLDELLRMAPMEERIYRLRCVEGWSMVLPWIGWSLSALLNKVEPTSRAKFVSFTTLNDPKQMPGLASRVLDWPYVEGLRIDEAMHPLTLMAMGLYGEVMPPQNGAPIRLVVPWKYGFKSAKSIVAIRLTEQAPRTSWSVANPGEYGFYSNVNPKVDHPRWSQASERRIGEDGLFTRKRPTLMFNGYEAQVGQLYAGMDLVKNF